MEEFWYITYDYNTLTTNFTNTDYLQLLVAIDSSQLSNVQVQISTNATIGAIQRLLTEIYIGMSEIINDEIEYNKNTDKNIAYISSLTNLQKYISCENIYSQIYWPYSSIPYFIIYRITASLFRLEKALLYFRNTIINQKIIQANPASFSLKTLINKQQQSLLQLSKSNPNYNRFNGNNFFINLNLNLLSQFYTYINTCCNQMKKQDNVKLTIFLNNQLKRIYVIAQGFVNLSQEDIIKENNLLNKDLLVNFINFVQIEHKISSSLLGHLIEGGNLVDVIDFQEKQEMLNEMSNITNLDDLPRYYYSIAQKLVPGKFNQMEQTKQMMISKIEQKLKTDKEKINQSSVIYHSNIKQQQESSSHSFKKVQSGLHDKKYSESRQIESLHLQTPSITISNEFGHTKTPTKTQKYQDSHSAFSLDTCTDREHSQMIQNFNEETIEQIKLKKSLANITASDLLLANEAHIKKYKTMEKKGIQDKLQYIPANEKPDNSVKDQSIFNEDEYDEQDDRIQLNSLRINEEEKDFFDFIAKNDGVNHVSKMLLLNQKGILLEQSIFVSKKQEGWERIRQFLKNRIIVNKVKQMNKQIQHFNIIDQIKLNQKSGRFQ